MSKLTDIQQLLQTYQNDISKVEKNELILQPRTRYVIAESYSTTLTLNHLTLA